MRATVTIALLTACLSGCAGCPPAAVPLPLPPPPALERVEYADVPCLLPPYPARCEITRETAEALRDNAAVRAARERTLLELICLTREDC